MLVVLGIALIISGVILGLRTAPRNEAGFYTGPAIRGGAPAALLGLGVFLLVLGFLL